MPINPALALAANSLPEQRQLVSEVRKAAQERGLPIADAVSQWSIAVARGLLASTHEGDVKTGLELVREVPGVPLYDECLGFARRGGKFPNQRKLALEVCSAVNQQQAETLLAEILHGADEPMDVREHAGVLLSRINKDSTREVLQRELSTAPAGLALSLATCMADSPQGAELLLATIQSGKASPQLLQDRGVNERVRGRNLPDADQRIKTLTANLPPADQGLKNLLAARRKLIAESKPDVPQGAALFKKNCAVCHRIGDDGARIGPSLDGVGVRGVDRLLEDVLDPNRNVDQAFRTTHIVTVDGRLVSGLMLREEGQILVLADAQGKELRVPAADVEHAHRERPVADAEQLVAGDSRRGVRPPDRVLAHPAANRQAARCLG